MTKVAVDLGTTATGEPAEMDLEELLSTRLLVQGNSGSGKSHLFRRVLEQSAGWVQQAIIDPEGDFVSFADRFGHLVVDADRTPAELQRIAEAHGGELAYAHTSPARTSPAGPHAPLPPHSIFTLTLPEVTP